MTEAATKRLIADEIKRQLLPNGAIHDVIKNEILKSTLLGGVAASALDPRDRLSAHTGICRNWGKCGCWRARGI